MYENSKMKGDNILQSESESELKYEIQDIEDDLKRTKNRDIEEPLQQRQTTPSFMAWYGGHRQKGFFRRNFGHISQGGVRSSVFTMFTATVGAGVLSLPYIISYFGLGLGIFLILTGAWLNYLGYLALNNSIIITGKNSFSNLCSYYFGKTGGRICTLFIMGINFLTCAIYTCISWQFAEKLYSDYIQKLPMKDANKGIYDEYSPTIWKVRGGILGMFFLATLPICLMKKMYFLRYLSLLVLGVIMTAIFVTVYQAPSYYKELKNNEKYHFTLAPEFDKAGLHWISGYATIIMSFFCQPVFMHVRSEFPNKTQKRIKKVIRTAIGTEMLLYLLISTAGYWSLGSNLTPPMFTLRRPLEGSNDYIMKILQWIFVLVTLLHIPLSLFALRDQFYTFLKFKRNLRNHVFLTIFLNFIAFLIPLVYPNILGLFGIVGGLFATLVGIIIPYSMKVMEEKKRKKIGFTICFYLLGIFFAICLAISSTTVSILDLINETE